MIGNCDSSSNTFFLACSSTVAAIVAAEAGLLGDSDSYPFDQSYDAFNFGHEWNLLEKEEHPWCVSYG